MDIHHLLREQHADLRAILDEVRSSPLERCAIVVEMLADAVYHHWAVEERHLYPVLDGRGYDALPRSAELHRALPRLVDELRPECGDHARFAAVLDELAEAIDAHIDDERRHVLPFVAKALDDSESQAIAHRMAETVAELENEDWLGTPDAAHHASSSY